MNRPKALVSWSSGKDSAWTLHVLRQRDQVDIVGLLTTVNEVHDRVAMHAVRTELLRAQANAVTYFSKTSDDTGRKSSRGRASRRSSQSGRSLRTSSRAR
jgi:diphthamide synthase (EF-2-diphthine--ammonia ligase)